jgi:hypothetical protein
MFIVSVSIVAVLITTALNAHQLELPTELLNKYKLQGLGSWPSTFSLKYPFTGLVVTGTSIFRLSLKP